MLLISHLYHLVGMLNGLAMEGLMRMIWMLPSEPLPLIIIGVFMAKRMTSVWHLWGRVVDVVGKCATIDPTVATENVNSIPSNVHVYQKYFPDVSSWLMKKRTIKIERLRSEVLQLRLQMTMK